MRLRTVGVKLSLALIALVAGALGDRLRRRRPHTREPARGRSDLPVAAHGRRDRHRLHAGGGRPATSCSQISSPPRASCAGCASPSTSTCTETPVFLRRSPIPDGWASRRPRSDCPTGRRARRTSRGVVERGRPEFAEVARSFGGLYILLVSAPIDDTLETVSLVRERILAAGLIALLAAALVGFPALEVFARRIHRLERAAERIAGGRFDEPVVDKGADELAELAAAFDRMRERLAALERARREFIANASHELRTPIFALGGHVELLTDEDMDEETRREFLAEMRIQVERLTKLATDLLDLSRLDAGRLHVEMAPVDLARDRRLARGGVRRGRARPGSRAPSRARAGRHRSCRRGASAADRAHPGRERDPPHPGGHGDSRSPPRKRRERRVRGSRTAVPGSRPGISSRSSSASTAATGRSRPAPASALRSRRSSRR